MKLGWLSDIHLNFLNDDEISAFLSELASIRTDAWVISGDIGEAHSVLDYLDRLRSGLGRPLYFVLGNHDYYGGSIAEVTQRVQGAVRDPEFVWLNSSGPVFLARGLAVVGDDGWGDARLGDPLGSQVELADFYCIRELTGLARRDVIRTANALGDACAARLAPKLAEAASRCGGVCIATHVPPFEGAAWYEGRTSAPEWLPWFSCAAMGHVIRQCAERHPDVRFLVLCGHTHGQGYFEPSANVVVHTAGAKYRVPELQGIVIDDGERVHLRSG